MKSLPIRAALFGLVVSISSSLSFSKEQSKPVQRADSSGTKKQSQEASIPKWDCESTESVQSQLNNFHLKSCKPECSRHVEYLDKKCMGVRKDAYLAQEVREKLRKGSILSAKAIKMEKDLVNFDRKLEAASKDLATQCKENEVQSDVCRSMTIEYNSLMDVRNEHVQILNEARKNPAEQGYWSSDFVNADKEYEQKNARNKACEIEIKELITNCEEQKLQNISSFEFYQGFEDPTKGTPDRSFLFQYSSRKPEDNFLLIDDAAPRVSQTRSSAWYFLPRSQNFQHEIAGEREKQKVIVTLSNGEQMVFGAPDFIPEEGVLRQIAKARPGNYPAFKYIGNQLAIRADWQGDGSRKKRKVEAFYEGQSCDLTKLKGLFPKSDAELLASDKTVVPIVAKTCGWKLDSLDKK